MNRSSSRTYRAATWRSRVLVAVLGTATGIGVLGVGVAFGYWLTTNGANPAQAVAASLSAPLSPTSTETGSATITVGWTLPGSQLSGAQYQVTRTSGPGSPTTVCTVTSATTSCPDTGLSAGTTYGYSVMAVLHSWQSSTITTSGTALEVTTSSLPGGVVGASYSTTLTAIGGSGTYSHWALGSGTLPSWATLNTSTGAITGTPNAAGTTSGLTFVVTDSLGYTTTSVSLSLTVNPDTATVTAFTVAGSPATYGAETSLVFSTTVASGHGEGIPNTDTVTVTQGATTLCTVTLTSRSGTCSPASATVLAASGSAYTATATFNSAGADPNFITTATKTTSVTVNKDSTITTVSETPTTVTYGNESASIFTASVSATHGEAVPNSETVTVNVGSTSCTVTLTAGTGTCTIGNTALWASVTAYAVSATYAGDTNLTGSTGTAATNLTVTEDSIITTVSETPTTVTYGNESASIFTASVSATYGEAAPNSETVTVSVGSTNCTVTLTAGTGTCTIANTALAASGTAYTVGASYAGDTNLSGSTGSASTGLTVSKATQTVTFTTPAPADAAVAGTYAPVASATSGLPVALTIDATTSTVCSISASVVTFNTTGTCTIDANQSGGTNYSAALQFQQTINPVHIGKLVITTPAVSGASSPPSTTTTPNLGQITVQLENGAGMPITTGSILTVALASTSSGGKFGASQFAGTPETTVSIASGTGTASFWYGDSNTGSPTITASATNYVSGTQTETITVAPAGLAIFIAPGSLGTLGSGCTTVSTTYTCNVTGLLAAGSISFYVEFANSSGTQVVYSTTQSSSIAETGQSSGTVTIAAGASTSNPGTLNAVYVVVLGGPSILEFGPYTLTISIS